MYIFNIDILVIGKYMYRNERLMNWNERKIDEFEIDTIYIILIVRNNEERTYNLSNYVEVDGHLYSGVR